jgi:hypothetical protein
MADSLLYEQSLETQGGSEPFISRQVVQVLDQNGGNYNGQIQIDTSSLSNSGKYASYGEAYLVLPLVTVLDLTTITGATGTNAADLRTALHAAEYPFAAGLKCGSHQLIHSLSVSYNNSDVVQLTPYTNFYVQYKQLTQQSWEDVAKNGPSIGFYPDTADTYDFISTADDDAHKGFGVRNNKNGPAGTVQSTGINSITAALRSGTVTGGSVANLTVDVSAVDVTGTFNPALTYTNYLSNTYNEGFTKRQRDTAYQSDTLRQLFISQTDAESVGKSLYTKPTVAPTDHTYKVWYTLAKIYLKDVHSFFEQLPLVKGAFLSLRINTNTATHTLSSVYKTAGPELNLYCTTNVINGGTSPVMLASGEAGSGLYPLVAAVKARAAALDNNTSLTWSLRTSIGKDTTLSLTHPTWQSQTRLFVPMYQMSPTDEEKYLSLNRTKRIVYEDIYSYQVNVDAGGSFNQLLTNGIPNPTTVVCIPFLRNTANDISGAGTNLAYPFQSPFATEPGTTSPLIAFKDFNVQVAGINMFTQNENYDFEQFLNELSSKNSINGNLVKGLTSGLISEHDFYHSYRYYVCDVSRRLPAEDSVPKSIAVMGKSLCVKAISIFVFVLFKREITVDLATGQKLD